MNPGAWKATLRQGGVQVANVITWTYAVTSQVTWPYHPFRVMWLMATRGSLPPRSERTLLQGVRPLSSFMSLGISFENE